MGKIGYGYGSECHLLRWMGRHRHAFDAKVMESVRAENGTIHWLDFAFDSKELWPDSEPIGLRGLQLDPKIVELWSGYWPQSGNTMNWDSVGWLHRPNQSPELLLVEAKAHTGELFSDCSARSSESITMINAALDLTKQRLGSKADCDWKTKYYQHTNRLVVLDFLRKNGVIAHLICIYFVGDKQPGANCPTTIAQWMEVIGTRDRYLGLDRRHYLEDRVQSVFLSVDGSEPSK